MSSRVSFCRRLLPGWARRRVAVTGAAILCLAGAAPAASEETAPQDGKIAFVVVSSSYEHIRRPALDGDVFQRIATALEKRGFKVLASRDERGAVLRARITRFANAARQADIALVILAGHFASNARAAFYLPVETEVWSASDIVLRGLPTRSFALAVGEAQRGLVVRLATDPGLASRLGSIVSYPRPPNGMPAETALVSSADATTPAAERDGAAARAADRLLQSIEAGHLELPRLADTVAASKPSLIVGSLSPLTSARQRADARRREDDAREEAERARRQAEEAARERARVAVAERADAQERAKEMEQQVVALDRDRRLAEKRAETEMEARREAGRRADEAMRERQQAERRAETAEQRVAALREENDRLRQRIEELSRVEDKAETLTEARKVSEARVEDAEAKLAAARSALAEARQKAAAREAALTGEIDELKTKLSALEQGARTPAAGGTGATSAGELAPTPDAGTAKATSGYALSFLRRMDALFKPDQRQKIQARLKAKGFLAANAPAAFGTETRGAIRQYQASIGAQPTGYLTPPQFLQLIGE